MERGRRPPQHILLDATAERLLRWLERYPFQRACDLQVALAPWSKRTAIYERLAELERDRLLEVLYPTITQGKRLYHLSPLGIAVCDRLAAQSDPPCWQRWVQGSRAQVVREEREKLVRLLPRLPVSLLMQDLANGLVRHASSALTNQGRQAQMVQWGWLRQYRLRFVSPREKPLHLRVDGVLALCWHFLPADQSSFQAGRQAQPSERWATLFLLHCPLEEIRLIRLRLDRLLRWRESAERTAVYSQMPPLLILATHARQAEWWHQAAVETAARLGVALPTGALACLPDPSQGLTNGWHLFWQRLGSRQPCHLQDLLPLLPAPALPELLAGRGSASLRLRRDGEVKGHTRAVALPRHLRLGTFALAGSPPAPVAAARTRLPPSWPRDLRLAGLWLTPRHWEILRLCFAHPFLSRDDYTPLVGLSRTTVNLLLADLTRARYLTSISTPVGQRWQLGEAGLRLLADLAWCPVHRLVRFPLEDKPLEQRGADGLENQIHHTSGVYGFFAQLTEALATCPQAHLRWWETGVISERHFRFREKIYRFRPDALACVQVGERQIRFWLEWDRGTMKAQDLRIKFTTYAMYLHSREWASSSPFLPALLCVAPHSGQEQRLAEAARQCLKQVPVSLRMYLTTAHLLSVRGPLAPIWQPVLFSRPETAQTPARIALFSESEAMT